MPLNAVLGSAAGALASVLRPPPEASAGRAGRSGGGAPGAATPALATAAGSVAGLQRLADRHLQAAGQDAAADLGRWSTFVQGVAAAQGLVGDLPDQAQAAAAAL